MTANPPSCPRNVDIRAYRPEPLAVTEVVISTPRMRLANVVEIAVHPRAKFHCHGVALPLQLLGSVLQRRGNLLLGTAALFLEDLAALCAEPRRETPTP